MLEQLIKFLPGLPGIIIITPAHFTLYEQAVAEGVRISSAVYFHASKHAITPGGTDGLDFCHVVWAIAASLGASRQDRLVRKDADEILATSSIVLP